MTEFVSDGLFAYDRSSRVILSLRCALMKCFIWICPVRCGGVGGEYGKELYALNGWFVRRCLARYCSVRRLESLMQGSVRMRSASCGVVLRPKGQGAFNRWLIWMPSARLVFFNFNLMPKLVTRNVTRFEVYIENDVAGSRQNVLVLRAVIQCKTHLLSYMIGKK